MDSHDANDRHKQDTRNPKPVTWDILHNDYSLDKDPELELLSTATRNEITCHQVPPDVCNYVNKVTLEEFKELVSYINMHYRKVRSKQKSSGFRKPVAYYCGGKLWLIYWHVCVKEIGDPCFNECAYVKLNTIICHSSNELNKL